MDTYKPKLVCFSCKFGWGYLSGGDGNAPRELKELKDWIPVACSGKIDATHILEVLKNGADGVLILGCPEGKCHFQDGNFKTEAKVHLLHKVLAAYGIEDKRVEMKFSIDPDGRKIPQLINEMKKNIAKLGPIKRA